MRGVERMALDRPSPDGRGLERRRAEGDPFRRKGEGRRRQSAKAAARFPSRQWQVFAKGLRRLSVPEQIGQTTTRRLTPTDTGNPHPFALPIASLLEAQALSHWERVDGSVK